MKPAQSKLLVYFGLLCLFFGIQANACFAQNNTDAKIKTSVSLFYDNSEPTIIFAAKDLQTILEGKNFSVVLLDLSKLSAKTKGNQIIIAKNDAKISALFKTAKGTVFRPLQEQDYALRVTGSNNAKSYWVIGGDRVGAMYGGIHVGEIVKAFGLASVKDADESPYIRKRGLKFNIPLDERQPSHDDRGTSAQANVAVVWEMDFWKEYLDVLARQRYNVLSLWNKHPFPSMVKLKDYPDVALSDVYNNAGKVRTMTVDQKIDFWKKVMDMAYDRGIEIHIITWNIHVNGALNKYGITEAKDNETTKDYLRKSVKQIFLTYPRLAAIGVTAGENMGGMTPDEKEQWMWETYGKGVQDVEKEQPERKIRFVHRHWWTEFDKVDSRFGQLKNGFDMEFKYSRARIYSDVDPPFAEKELLPGLPEGMATWWNIRNDDIYNLRWGDAEYVKQFILHFPEGGKTAGYYMGSDRFAWARESISLHPTTPRMLENEKHWYSFLLWGRLGYDPETPVDLLKGLLHDRFPTAPTQNLYSAWQAASKVIPLVNKFHWFSWDYLWWPEAGISTGYGAAIAGYHDINDFIKAPVMDNTDLMTIPKYAAVVLKNENAEGKQTPLQVADSLDAYASVALKLMEGMSGGGSNELEETIGDIRAMAHLGNYYAAKIRGAANLALFQESKDEKHKTAAVADLEKSLLSWQQYSKILAKQYIKMTIAMQGIFDWDKLEEEVKADIDIAKQAK